MDHFCLQGSHGEKRGLSEVDPGAMVVTDLLRGPALLTPGEKSTPDFAPRVQISLLYRTEPEVVVEPPAPYDQVPSPFHGVIESQN